MTYVVYMLKVVSCRNKLSYVGYTKNLEKRLSLHNSGRGAKFTRGNNWKLIFKKKFITKNEAMSYEYILKNDKKKRKNIYNNSK